LNYCFFFFSFQNPSVSKSNRGGWQSRTTFFDTDHPAVRALRTRVLAAAALYLNSTARVLCARPFVEDEDFAAYLRQQQLQHSSTNTSVLLDAFCPSILSQVADRRRIRLDVLHAWANVNEQHHFNMPHSHPDSHLSGVYYVSTGRDPSSAVYFSPPGFTQDYIVSGCSSNLRDQISHIELTESCSSSSSSSIRSHPLAGGVVGETSAAGKFVMFPAWLEHFVAPHRPVFETTAMCEVSDSDSDSPCSDAQISSQRYQAGLRVSIAFNLRVSVLPPTQQQQDPVQFVYPEL